MDRHRPLSDAAAHVVELAGQSNGRCDCCGSPSRNDWGWVHRPGAETVAAFLVRRRLEHPTRDADIDLVVGPWGEGTEAADRVVVALRYREDADGPAVMFVDASPDRFAALADRAVTRAEILGTPLAATALALVDALVGAVPPL